MCEKCGCTQPEKRKDKKPEECTPEQVKECHGDEKKHPCCPGGEKDGDKPGSE